MEDRMMKYFRHPHVPPHLTHVGSYFESAARHVVETLPSGPERTVTLRKLLEAQDAAFRCATEAASAD